MFFQLKYAIKLTLISLALTLNYCSIVLSTKPKFTLVNSNSSDVEIIKENQFYITTNRLVELECIADFPIKITVLGLMVGYLSLSIYQYSPDFNWIDYTGREIIKNISGSNYYYRASIGFNGNPKATGLYTCSYVSPNSTGNGNINTHHLLSSSLYIFANDGTKSKIISTYSSIQEKISILKTKTEVLIPCVTSDPHIRPNLSKYGTNSTSVALPEDLYTFEPSQGFFVNVSYNVTPNNYRANYSCTVNEEDRVTYQVDIPEWKVNVVESEIYLSPGENIFFKCESIRPTKIFYTLKNKSSVTKKGNHFEDLSSYYKYLAVLNINETVLDKDVAKWVIQCTVDKQVYGTWTVQYKSTHRATHTQQPAAPNEIVGFHEGKNLFYCSVSKELTPSITSIDCNNLVNCETAEKFDFHNTLTSAPVNVSRGYGAEECKEYLKEALGINKDNQCAVIPAAQNLTLGIIRCLIKNATQKSTDKVLTEPAVVSMLYYTNLNNLKLRTDKSEPTPADVLQFKDLNGTVYFGQKINITCEAASVLFAKGMELRMMLKNGTKTIALDSVQTSDNRKITIKQSFHIWSMEIVSIECSAYDWDAHKWKRISKEIQVKENQTFRVTVKRETGWIFYTIGGVCLVILLAFLLVVFVLCKTLKSQKSEIEKLSEVEIQHFMNGNQDLVQRYEELNDVAQYLPYKQQYEIHPSKIDIKNDVLGSGDFGMVLRGVLEKSGKKFHVAVKTVKSGTDIRHLKSLLSEIKIMMYIGKHPHIIELLGAITKELKDGKLYVIVEFCSNGSLQSYLRSCRPIFLNQIVDDEIKTNPTPTIPRSPRVRFLGDAITTALEKRRCRYSNAMPVIKTTTLITWCHEVATGMEFLASKKVVHGDLATRNLLITDNLSVKITDFGLSRHLYAYTDYVKKQQTEPLPWRWLSIEGIQDSKFSTESDVWAYGVTLWEIFSLAETPYQGFCWGEEFVQDLSKGYRMGKPTYANNELHNTMLECWKAAPKDRPTFTDIANNFKEMLQRMNCSVQQVIMEVNVPKASSSRQTQLLRVPTH